MWKNLTEFPRSRLMSGFDQEIDATKPAEDSERFSRAVSHLEFIDLWASDEPKKKTDIESNMLSEYGMAALMGFCGVSNWREVPALYVVLQRVKDNGEARDIILEGMLQWQTDNGIEIHQNIFLPEDLIKNIRAIKPNPTKMSGTSQVSNVEFTNLVCLPLRPAEIEAKFIAEQAASSTEANRTKTEKEKQLKGESRNPPNNYWGVKLNVATTAALVSVCYGGRTDCMQTCYTSTKF
eukprot:scaffold5989_cov47-Cyclotella_meneghiniana.AAC.5